MRRKLSQDAISFIIDLYNLGKTQIEIAKQLNCSQTYVSKILLNNNIKTRVGKKVIYNDVNYQLFDKINNEKSAYFLGLLYADGCVSIRKSGYTLSLKLQSSDQDIIEKFRDIISPSSPIKICNKKYSYFRINQKEICQQLIRHGCVPNKSLTLKFPDTIPKRLLRHFIRGYSDGDGCIYNNKLKYSTNTIWKIVSTNQFCEVVKKILKEELGVNSNIYLSKPATNQVTSTLVVGGNIQVKRVLDWLYKKSKFYLLRKRDKYLLFIKNYSSSKV